MLFFVYLILSILITSVSSDTSASFCLCALKPVLAEYALFAADRSPPVYYSSFKNDIGFYIRADLTWKPVNDATWMELASMINAPSGMYTYISINGINPINNGLQLDGHRSAHLAEIITAYRSMMDYVNIFHENVIKTRSEICKMQTAKQSTVGKSTENIWQQFFVPRSH